MAQISFENPFGNTKYPPDSLKFVAVLTDEQRIEGLSHIDETIKKFESLETIFYDKKKAFLKNAIDYYHRSLGDSRLEEKLIDIIISLESLFSLDTQELRLRYSLRASFFLGVEQESERSNIFRTVYNLYQKRNEVVHGIADVDLDERKIWILQEYLRETIKRFLHIDMRKQDLLKLIDESVYDVEKREQLSKKILEATQKW